MTFVDIIFALKVFQYVLNTLIETRRRQPIKRWFFILQSQKIEKPLLFEYFIFPNNFSSSIVGLEQRSTFFHLRSSASKNEERLSFSIFDLRSRRSKSLSSSALGLEDWHEDRTEDDGRGERFLRRCSFSFFWPS